MGEALICGFIRAGICSPGELCASVRSEERRQRMLELGLQVGWRLLLRRMHIMTRAAANQLKGISIHVWCSAPGLRRCHTGWCRAACVRLRHHFPGGVWSLPYPPSHHSQLTMGSTGMCGGSALALDRRNWVHGGIAPMHASRGSRQQVTCDCR